MLQTRVCLLKWLNRYELSSLHICNDSFLEAFRLEVWKPLKSFAHILEVLGLVYLLLELKKKKLKRPYPSVQLEMSQMNLVRLMMCGKILIGVIVTSHWTEHLQLWCHSWRCSGEMCHFSQPTNKPVTTPVLPSTPPLSRKEAHHRVLYLFTADAKQSFDTIYYCSFKVKAFKWWNTSWLLFWGERPEITWL